MAHHIDYTMEISQHAVTGEQRENSSGRRWSAMAQPQAAVIADDDSERVHDKVQTLSVNKENLSLEPAFRRGNLLAPPCQHYVEKFPCRNAGSRLTFSTFVDRFVSILLRLFCLVWIRTHGITFREGREGCWRRSNPRHLMNSCEKNQKHFTKRMRNKLMELSRQ